jgi:hypothetical protein
MRVLLILWIVILAGVSMSPLGVKQRLHTTGHLHYLGHFFVFALTATAVLRGCTTRLSAQIFRSGMIVCLALALEAGQALVHHGRFEKRDLLVDVFGIAAGFVVVKATSRSR